jgi:hypothetical protein
MTALNRTAADLAAARDAIQAAGIVLAAACLSVGEHLAEQSQQQRQNAKPGPKRRRRRRRRTRTK